MKKNLLIGALAICSVAYAFALETATVYFWKDKGPATTKTIRLQKQPDGAMRAVVPVVEITRDLKFIDIVADDATAKKGEKGFFVLGDSSYGEFTQDKGYYKPRWPHMPIMGMQNAKGTWVAIVKGLPLEQQPVITAEKGVYKLFPRFDIKEMYFDAYEDIIVDFYPLDKNTGYSEMAKVYRNYQLARGEVKTLRERTKDNPSLAYTADSIYVRIKHARKKAVRGIPSHHTQTVGNEPEMEIFFTFDDMADIMKRMKAIGIDKAEVCSVGWNVAGHDGRFPTYFPVEEKIGGEKKFREVIKYGKDLGYNINCHINQVSVFEISDRWKDNGIATRANGKPYKTIAPAPGGDLYWACYQRVHDMWIKDDYLKIRDLGLNGIFHIDVMAYIGAYPCCDPKHPLNRKQTAEYMNKVGEYTDKIFGGYASEGGQDHCAKTLDFALYLWSYPAWEGKPERLATKYVPLYQLVYNGIIMSNPYYTTIDALYPKSYSTSDQRKAYDYLDNPENRWLKLIEFNGRPIFYYSDYSDLKPMKRAYDEWQKIKHLQYEFMTYHGEPAPKVSLIRYSNGDEIVVNYSDEAYTHKNEVVHAKSYKLFKKSFWDVL